MKKMIFESMSDLHKMMEFFEKHDIKYSWNFLNKAYELHLGTASADQIKALLRDSGLNVPFKWGDYYW